MDKGKVYAIIVINLELEDHKENVKIIAKNNIADYMYRFCKIKDKILIEGNLQNTTDGLMVIVNNVEKLNGKVERNQYDKLLTYENLMKAHKKSQKGKKLRKEVIMFSLKEEEYIRYLYQKLKTGTYVVFIKLGT